MSRPDTAIKLKQLNNERNSFLALIRTSHLRANNKEPYYILIYFLLKSVKKALTGTIHTIIRLTNNGNNSNISTIISLYTIYFYTNQEVFAYVSVRIYVNIYCK